MNSEQQRQSLILRGAAIAMMIVLAAILRIVPHPWNLAPIGAMALFSGAMFRNRWIAFLFPVGSLFAGDLFIDFHKLMFIVYASFAISVAIGRRLGASRSAASAACFANACRAGVLSMNWKYTFACALTAWQ